MQPILLNNRYEIQKRIGVGGMAYVYEAEDVVLKRRVAVKILKDQFAEDEEFVQKFENEALAAASLSHPNIVTVYDVGHERIEERMMHYIVMELVEGTTLKEAIRSHGIMTSAAIAKTGKQIAYALERAHERHLVHRDVKPANILITRNGDIKVTDFGIARITSSATVTFTNNILGTVHYISPEQAKGQPVEGKSDIYSLGVVLYEMATGEVPFDSDSSVAIAMKHIQEAPVPPIEKNPSLHPGLNQIILTCLEKNPADRFSTALELASALENYREWDDTQVLPQATTPIPVPPVQEAKEVVYESPGPVRDVEKKPNHTLRRSLLLAGLAVVTFLLVAFFLLSQNQDAKRKLVSVPAVLNLTENEALQQLADNGLVGKVTERREDDQVEKGLVLNQSVASGTPVEKGTTIELTISDGLTRIQIPSVAGMTAEEATRQLEDQGLRVGQRRFVNSDEVPKDRLVGTDPAIGTEVSRGTRVDLLISRGQEAEKVVVPVLINQPQNQALQAIAEAGLKLGQMKTKFSSWPSGTVIEQSITAGTQVDRQTSIDIVVSSGQEQKSTEESNGPATVIYSTRIFPPAGRETFEVTIFDRKQSTTEPIFKKTFHAKDVNSQGYISAQVEAPEGADFMILIDGQPASQNPGNNGGAEAERASAGRTNH